MSTMAKVPGTLDAAEEQQKALAQHDENRRITGEDYDRSLAVKCVNGTFVGRKTGNVITYKGIPFVGKQPVGELRWKAPVDFKPDDGVYEAHYAVMTGQNCSMTKIEKWKRKRKKPESGRSRNL